MTHCPDCGAVIEDSPRSQNSHNHFFASVAESWRHLPEAKLDQYPSPTILRYWCLIKAGYRDEQSVVVDNPKEARTVARAIRLVAKEYCVVVVKDNIIKVYTPKSQSKKAMGAAVFQKSKDDVSEVIAKLIGVAPGELKEGNAA